MRILARAIPLAVLLTACNAAGTTPEQSAEPTAVAAQPDEHAGEWSQIRQVRGFLRPDLVPVGDRALILFGATDAADFIAGAIYDPVSGDLDPIANGGLEWRAGHVVAPAGDLVLVYGGDNGPGLEKHGLYDPAANEWLPVATSPLGDFSTHHSFWTGDLVLTLPIGSETPLTYDPALDEWTTGTPNPFLAERTSYAAVWTGEEAIVWGGCDITVGQCDDFVGGDELAGGAAYNPVTDEWRDLPESGLAVRDRPQAVWSGTEMIVWGGNVDDSVDGAYGAAYHPVNNSWRVIAEAPIGHRSLHSAVWTGTEMIVWGGGFADGAAYDPSTDTWLRLPSGPLPPIDRHAAIWIADRMLIFGGFPPGPAAEYIPSDSG